MGIEFCTWDRKMDSMTDNAIALFHLTAVFSKTGAMQVPTKSQNPTVCS